MNVKSAVAWAFDKLRATAGATVTYKRGAQTIPNLSVTKGRTEYEEMSGEGLVIRQQRWDFLVKASALVIAAVATLPQEGDQIVEVDGGKTYTYDVLPIPNGETWRYADQFRQEFRIHTKLRTIA